MSSLPCLNLRRTGLAKPGFTLVELLAVIAILTMLATLLLFALFGVMQEGKVARTKAQIAKLNEIVMQQYDTYQYRPVPMVPGATSLAAARTKRLRALRELERLELPDRKDDVLTLVPGLLSARPALSEAYLRKISNGWSAANQGSECLYLIVSQANDGFSPALEAFSTSELLDTDGDGMTEIVDGWGTPINFLRWAPGYTCNGLNVMQKNDPVNQHDPFDITLSEPNAYALYPVIYSAGPDRQYGIDDSPTANYTSGGNAPDPFTYMNMGATVNTYDVDNLTNHNQEQR